jgi:hypothetical protein
MIENKNWESLVWIIVWILLLSFVILGLYNLIIYSESTNINFGENSVKWILKENTINIIYKIGIDWVNEWSGFYIYKDNMAKEFKVFTWSDNIKYKYIDKNWELIDTWVTDTPIFEREVIVDKIDQETNAKMFNVIIGNYNRNN